MAMSGLRPVVAIYSTFLSRAWDQVVYDVALHRLPVIFCLDRAGVTGPDGASHHGMYDLALLTKVPGMRVLAPSSAQELLQMLTDAATLADDGPVVIRYPRGEARQMAESEVGTGLSARRLAEGDGGICLLAVGRMLETAEEAAALLAERGQSATVWDVRSCSVLDPAMLADAARHDVVVTLEDGIADGGVGAAIIGALGDSDTRPSAPRSACRRRSFLRAAPRRSSTGSASTARGRRRAAFASSTDPLARSSRP